MLLTVLFCRCIKHNGIGSKRQTSKENDGPSCRHVADRRPFYTKNGAWHDIIDMTHAEWTNDVLDGVTWLDWVTQDTSDLKMWVRSVRAFWFFGTRSEVSRDISVLGPKCLGSEVSWVWSVRYASTAWCAVTHTHMPQSLSSWVLSK